MHGRTNYEELTTRNRLPVAEHKCTDEMVYRAYCVHTEEVVTSCEFYSLGYYNRFYLYILVPAEIGEMLVLLHAQLNWRRVGPISIIHRKARSAVSYWQSRL